MKLKACFMLFFAVLFVWAGLTAYAKTCPICGAKDISSLAMFCPECGASANQAQRQTQLNTKAVLRVRLLYTGKSNRRLPPYAKLYINNVYKGDVSLVSGQSPLNANAGGLDKGCCAVYEACFGGLNEGTARVKLEMKFKRMYGLMRSIKRVEYPYVCLKNGQETLLEHSFYNAPSFGKRSVSLYNKPPAADNALSGVSLEGSDGAVKITVPLF